MFACVFLLLALIYTTYFNVSVRTDPLAAESRFNILTEFGAHKSATRHGARALKMLEERGVNDEMLVPLRARLAATMMNARKYEDAALLYEKVLASEWIQTVGAKDRAEFEDDLARAYITTGELARAVAIYTTFLNASGDEAARSETENEDSFEAYYVNRIDRATDLFAESLKPTGNAEKFSGSVDERLTAANKMTELGSFYALRESGLYAAAGLLSSAYEMKRQILGIEHKDTFRIALVLGPVYTQMGRLKDAEELYKASLAAQENLIGSNNPDLSLYLKLLVDVYQQQGRTTEAQALYEHMHGLFRDAFGEQRYASNRERDRRQDIDRPVSQYFVLESNYLPTDLVPAADYSVPVSKDHSIDEMKLRLAADENSDDPRERNLPARLAQLISLCRSESRERISLRSGFRSWHTQHSLFQRNGNRGTVTPPGMSEHQLGLAVDIDVNGRLMRRSDHTYQCFEENAYQFGFVLSYPPGNNYLPGEDSFEPWHWRYVGVRTAQLYREAGPFNKPQEFLAALPCYRERANSGNVTLIGEVDMCLVNEPATPVAIATSADDRGSAATVPEIDPKAARKLNNPGNGTASN